MANFCTNCGTKLGKNDNFCTNCGTKIDKSDIKQNRLVIGSMEKKKAKEELKRVVGGRLLYNKTFTGTLIHNGLDIYSTGKAIRLQVEKEIESGQIKSAGVEFRVNQLISEFKIKMEKEKEAEKKKLEMIDEIFESQEIKSQIMKNKIDQKYVDSVKAILKDKVIDNKEDMGEDEIKYFIKTELKKEMRAQEKRKREEQERARKLEEQAKIRKEQEMIRREMIENGQGGYCGFGCRHFHEEFLDEHGGVVGDFDSGGMFEYYCDLGHSAYSGKFCEYYEK